MMTRKVASQTHVPARHGDRRRAAVPRRHGAGVRRAGRRQAARAHGVRLRAERHRHAQLEPGLRGQARRTAAHPEAARAVQGRHPAARQPDAQHRPRAARWRGRSRPLLRLATSPASRSRRARSTSRPASRGPDRRQQDRQPDALSLARSRPGRRAPGRRLRLRLLLRLHQQPGVAQRDAAAAADPRSARAVRAPVRQRRGAEPRSARARRRKYRRSILDFVTEDTKKLQKRARAHRPAQARRVSVLDPRSRAAARARPRRTTRRSIRTWRSPTACRPISPSTSS